MWLLMVLMLLIVPSLSDREGGSEARRVMLGENLLFEQNLPPVTPVLVTLSFLVDLLDWVMMGAMVLSLRVPP